MKPVIRMIIALDPEYDRPTKEFPGFHEKLLDAFPDLSRHHCTRGEEGGFLERLSEGTYPCHVVEHAIIAFQNMLGYDVKYGRTRVVEEPCRYAVIYECINEVCAMECGKAATFILNCFLAGEPIEISEFMEYLKKVSMDAELGPSTAAIVGEARKRGIPVTRIGTESLELFEKVHADPNIDYLTIHIWPKNWGWFAPGKLAEDFPNAVEQTEKYIEENTAVAVKLNKPLVIEEFGLPRDRESFDPAAETTYRDRYFTKVLSFVRRDPYIAGANFWAFGGTGRPAMGHKLWKVGDEYMGDPPMEEQGLNSVFDSDRSTWDVIRKASHAVSRKAR
jgi:hypothetical protein